jgi:membrane protein YdbS with pleckstrin-like domain
MATLPNTQLLTGTASAVWLIGAAVAGHFLWSGVPWIVVMLLAAMAELMVLIVWLLGSTFHDPAKRWDLPPNPADAQRGWRGVLGRARHATQAAGRFMRQKVLRKPAKA